MIVQNPTRKLGMRTVVCICTEMYSTSFPMTGLETADTCSPLFFLLLSNLEL